MNLPVSANILNKQSWAADKVWFTSFETDHRNVTEGLRLGLILWIEQIYFFSASRHPKTPEIYTVYNSFLHAEYPWSANSRGRVNLIPRNGKFLRHHIEK